MGCDSQFNIEKWESSVEEPTRSRVVKDQGPKVDTVVFSPCKETFQVEQSPKKELRPPLTKFEQELRTLLNRYAMENASNTPDMILAEYLHACLEVFNAATRARERWYGRRVF